MQGRSRVLQAMQSFSTQKPSTAIEILKFLPIEIPFCVSWSIEREMCLFQSCNTPREVCLSSNFCEEKNAVLEPPWSLPMGNIYLGNLRIQAVIAFTKPASHQIEYSGMLFISALHRHGVLVIVKNMEKWAWSSNSTARNSRKGVWKVLHFPMSPSECFIVFRCLLFCTELTGTSLEFHSFGDFPAYFQCFKRMF